MITKGTKVLVNGHDGQGTILGVRDNFAEVSIGSQILWFPIGDLTDISDRLLNRLIGDSHDGALELILAVDASRLLNEYRFNPYVLASSTKITIFPHQIDEVMWGLERDRIMIADEVGLGKTIIAALIAVELKARGLADRTLYVVPKSLVLKWQDELSSRFDMETKILDADYLRYDEDPFSRKQYDYITSMDFLKSEERRQMIKNTDLVIVDEAHKFKINTVRLELGKVLSERTNSMIFLTATPHDGRDEDFMERMALLDNSVADISSSAYLWRRHVKENVVDMNGKTVFPKRNSTTVDIELTNNEREIHGMIDDYIRARSDEAITQRDHGAVRFLSTIFKKRAASSMAALRITLLRRREKLGATTGDKIQNAENGMKAKEEDNEGDYEDNIGDSEGIMIGNDTEGERREISRIISSMDEIGQTDSKFETLLEFIKKVKTDDQKAKILLFTEYRDTLGHLDHRLSRLYRTGRIDGTMSIQDRKQALMDFSQDTGPEILLCTDAAGEGIDMQFCNVEFNYDIPWNPNRLEQRMGRIHRIGQSRNVFYYNFIVDKENSIDGYILNMLFEKIERIKTAMGNDSIFDILGRIINQDMIAKIYVELLRVPKAEWNAVVVRALDEINENRERILGQTGQLLEGHKLDRTVLENISKIKRNAVDFREVRRFLETWAESSGGTYDDVDVKAMTARIIPPQSMASRVGILEGTFNGEIAKSNNWTYLALGNQNIQTILSEVSKKRTVAVLSHPTKEGLICVYKVSVIDGRGRERNSKTMALFCNEDGVITEIDPKSLWEYNDGEVTINTGLIAGAKNRTDERMGEISDAFYRENMEKLKKIKKQNKDAADRYAITKIDVCLSNIDRYGAKVNDAPHYQKLIDRETAKILEIKNDSEKKKADIEINFKSHVKNEMIAIAVVKANADANARMITDQKGMEIVMGYERSRANTAVEREQILDVSNRDKGYDIESPNRCIEVKSFKSIGVPSITSHEWETAGRLGDEYWLYVVEHVFDERKSYREKITAIQDPYRTLNGAVTPVDETTRRYQIKDWKEIKKKFADK